MDAATPALLRSATARALDNLQPTPVSDVVFTDDWAPVEQLTNSIVLRFILEGSVYQLDVQ
jgi:hypothetical protein